MPDAACSNCKAAIPAGATFCHNCGVDVPGAVHPADERKLCSGCLQPYSVLVLERREGEFFCPDCRETVGDRSVKPAPQKALSKEALTVKYRYTGPERKSERIQVPGSFVRMEKKRLLAGIFHGRSKDIGQLVDLSRGGGQCVTRASFEMGERLALELRIPGVSDPLCLTGVVVWVRQEDAEQQRMGIRFDPLSEADANIIAELEIASGEDLLTE